MLNNGSSHTAEAVERWPEAHPRFVADYTPPYASWLNQAELFFSVFQCKVIRNGNSISRRDLPDKLVGVVAVYDETAKPFRWTYAADPLVAA